MCDSKRPQVRYRGMCHGKKELLLVSALTNDNLAHSGSERPAWVFFHNCQAGDCRITRQR